MRTILIPSIFAFFFSGCAPVVSPGLRGRADKELNIQVLFKDPDLHKGKTVILGGIIVSSKNTGEGNTLRCSRNHWIIADDMRTPISPTAGFFFCTRNFSTQRFMQRGKRSPRRVRD
jgi:hypothetical protein